MSTPDAFARDASPHREEATRQLHARPDEQGAPAELVLQLQALRGFQNDLWDYVQALIRTSDSFGRCERLFDFLDAKREEAEGDLYWQGAGKILREMPALARTLPQNLLRAMAREEDAELDLVRAFDLALEAAHGHVRLARNPFEGGTKRDTIAYNLVDSVQRMQDAASGLADLCRGRAEDLSEQAKQCVAGILGFFNQIPAGPSYAPLRKPLSPEAGPSATSDTHEPVHEAPVDRPRGECDVALSLHQDRPTPDARADPDVVAHSMDWRNG